MVSPLDRLNRYDVESSSKYMVRVLAKRRRNTMIDFSLAIPVDFCTYQNSDLVFAFAGLQALTNFNFHFVEKIWVCPEMVADAIYPYTHRGSERVKEALDQLKAKRIVMRAPGGGYYVDQDSFAMPRDFVGVPMSDLKKFISNRKNVPELFSFYCFLLSTRAAVTQFKVGYMPQVYLAEQFGVSVAGVMRYNKALEEIGVLYVKRMPPTRLSTLVRMLPTRLSKMLPTRLLTL